MTIEGDADTDGSLRIEGTIRGDVRAGKSVVIGKDGLLEGSLYTQDAVIAGRVLGAVYAESYLELQATSEISGEIQVRRMHVEDGCAIQGRVTVRPNVDHSTGFEQVLWSTLSLCRAASRGIQQPEGEGGDREGRSWSNDEQASPLFPLHTDRRPPTDLRPPTPLTTISRRSDSDEPESHEPVVPRPQLQLGHRHQRPERTHGPNRPLAPHEPRPHRHSTAARQHRARNR